MTSTQAALPTRPIKVLSAIDNPPARIIDDDRFDIAVVPAFGPGTVLTDHTDAQVLLSDCAPANLDDFAQLRWWHLGSAGYTQVAGLGVRSRNLRVTNSSGVNDIPIAEWCVLMMMALGRDLPAMLDDGAGRVYQRPPRYQWELRGNTVGIVGYGGIGRELARQASAHGMRVVAMNRSPIGPATLRYAAPGTGDPTGTIPDRTVPWGEWATFCDDLDFLVVTAALNAATVGLIGTEQLNLLPDNAFVLNPARALLIDEGALRTALQEHKIAGAALDSHYREPMTPDDPTWQLPRTIVTPHISGSTGSPHYAERLWALFADNLVRFADGRDLANVVPADDLPD